MSTGVTGGASGRGGRTGEGFVRDLGVLDCAMIVAGSMIGSGIFIVSADMARLVGAPGWLLLAWIVTGLLTLAAALSYGELAAMMPDAGGQYVYLREAYSPLWGFLYGWTLFLVIQTGTIAAVAVAFARFLGVIVPSIAPDRWIVAPVRLSEGYALSLSTQQGVGIALIAVLTWVQTRGIHTGKIIQNVFTVTKTASLLALILLGIAVGRNADAIAANFRAPWTPVEALTIRPEVALVPETAAHLGVFGLFVAFCVAQVGSLFSSDAWNNVTFTAAEVKNPKRTIPLALVAGTGLVTILYILANLSYLSVLPLSTIRTVPDDRVATAALGVVFGPAGATIMAVAVVISTFGCNNGLILTGARVYWAMAADGLFPRSVGRLNARHVPAVGLVLQGIWASVLVLPRTRVTGADGTVTYGNLYSNLLDYVIFAVLLFYVLTIVGLFVLRRKRPDVPRPYTAWGYPLVPGFYLVAATAIMSVLVIYRSQTVWPGLAIAASGVPAYFLWRRIARG